MLPYTSFPADVFQVLGNMLYRMAPFNYYDCWAVTCFSIEDQLLMILSFNYRDMDLAVKFTTRRATVSNIITRGPQALTVT